MYATKADSHPSIAEFPREIWKKAMKERRKWERAPGEDEEAKERELEWGRGEIEK